MRRSLSLFWLLTLFLLTIISGIGQEVEDTIRIKTRVVFLDALVKDKKTNLPINNLTAENFEVLDNGQPRKISYFTREGQARKPLALILILDLREDGAGRFLKNVEILNSMEKELAKLPPEDEVAILAMDFAESERRLWVTEFTNDRSNLAAALAKVKAMCDAQAQARADRAERQQSIEEQKRNPASSQQASSSSLVANSGTEASKPNDPPEQEIVSTEVITAKNGATLTRTVMRDGTVNVKRVNKSGQVTIELDDIYDMAAAVRDSARKAAGTRPNSQVSLVWISDGIEPIFFEDRDATEQVLLRENIIFNSLTVNLRTLFKFLLPIGKPIAGWMGLSLYGSAKYLAQRSGGEAVKVNGVKDYGAGLARIIGNLTSRYSLGFALAENEVDDGKMHTLEVRVKAKDEKGRNRKLSVSSRQGYYMSSVAPRDAAAQTQQIQ